jgi:hypothetical protein
MHIYDKNLQTAFLWLSLSFAVSFESAMLESVFRISIKVFVALTASLRVK